MLECDFRSVWLVPILAVIAATLGASCTEGQAQGRSGDTEKRRDNAGEEGGDEILAILSRADALCKDKGLDLDDFCMEVEMFLYDVVDPDPAETKRDFKEFKLQEKLEKFAEVYVIIEQAMLANRMEVKPMTSLVSGYMHFGPLTSSRKLLFSRGLIRTHLGQSTEALEDAERLVHLALTLSEASSTVVECMVSADMLRKACYLMRANGTVPTGLVGTGASLRKKLAIAWSRVAKSETEIWMKEVGSELDASITESAQKVYDEYAARVSKLRFQRIDLPEVSKASGKKAELLSSIQHGLNLALYRVCISIAELRATRLIVLLRNYERETGSLPQNLKALFDQGDVPVDPFDGRPLRYSREHRYVYSVGTDGVDEGGATRPSKVEPTWFLDKDRKF